MEFKTFFRGEIRRIRCNFSLALTDSMGNIKAVACNVHVAPLECEGIFNNCNFAPVADLTAAELHSITSHAWSHYWLMKEIAEMVESI